MKKGMFLALIVISTAAFASETPHIHKGHAKKVVAKSLDFPVAGKRTAIRDKWGARRDGGARKHKGVDIHARKGTPVVAVSDGIIVRREHTPIGGKTVWLKPDHQAWTAYYAHLDKQLVKRGQRVHKGQVIGTVGNTGNARTTPSHLHFGVKKQGHWVNPLPYVKNATKITAAKPSKRHA